MPSSLRPLLLCFALGCSVPDLLTVHCPCAEGWTCVDDVCVPDDEVGSPEDAGTPNDSGQDAWVSGSDAGRLDAGIDRSDGGPRDARSTDDAAMDAAVVEDAGPVLPDPVATFRCGETEMFEPNEGGDCRFGTESQVLQYSIPDLGTEFTIYASLETSRVHSTNRTIVAQPSSPENIKNVWQLFENEDDRGNWQITFSSGTSDSNNVGVPVDEGTHYNLIARRKTTSHTLFLANNCSSSNVNDRETPTFFRISIGGDLNNNTPVFPFDGTIDEVRLYDTALSDEQIRALPGGRCTPVAMLLDQAPREQTSLSRLEGPSSRRADVRGRQAP